MPESTYQDRTQSQDNTARPFVLINSFTPKPGKIGKLAIALEAARDRFADRVPGFHGGRIYRDINNDSALFISVFETEDHYRNWIETAMFAEYHAQLADLTEGMGQSRIEANGARHQRRNAPVQNATARTS